MSVAKDVRQAGSHTAAMWPVVSLGEVFTIARGGSPRPIDAFVTDDPHGVNWIMIGDAVESSKYIASTKKRIRREGVSRSREVMPGDFLLTNSMSFGHPYILAIPGCIHDGWLVLSPRSQNVDRDYFYHLLGSPLIYSAFTSLAAGAVVKNLNSELVRGVKVSLPPIEEQRRIAAILDKADAIRRKRQRAIQLTESLLRSAFLEMFGDPVTNPKGWDVAKLGDLVDRDRGISYGVVQRGADAPGGVPVARICNIVNNRFDCASFVRTERSIAERYQRTFLRGGELVVSIRGTCGRVAVVPNEAAGWNISREVALVPLRKDLDAEFVRQVILTPGGQDFISGSVRGIAQRGINLADLRNLPVPQPRRHEIQRFRAFSNMYERTLRHIDDAANVSSALSASAMHRAFTGQPS